LLLSLSVNAAEVKSRNINAKARTTRIKREVEEGTVKVDCAL